MDNQRSDPDQLLKQVQAEENIAQKGKLRIFLGAAPGVGKTWAMLKDAIEQRKAGVDVVIGIIESHGRKEIEPLITEIEKLPLQTVMWHERQFMEFSLDGAIARNPRLILMDEMAHTNARGLRHTKRWQDIKELLDRQIDVYTTLNVQHIESLNDDVSRIIHAPVRETVPDSMLEMAESIELVDLPTEDLLKRLHEGKIYIPERAEMAAKHFFLKGNLIALREMALRVTARRVGEQVQVYRQEKGIRHVWSTQDKILVCVGPGIESLQLIRAGKQLATSLQADWIAVHVYSSYHPDSGIERNSAIQNLRLAEQLGAETSVLPGMDLVTEIMTFARNQNITLIMVWKPIRPRWKEIFSRQVADEIVRQSGEIDVYIMTANPGDASKSTISDSNDRFYKANIYGIALLGVGIATAINYLLEPFMRPLGQAILYLLIITLISLSGRILAAILTSFLSVIVFQWLFLPIHLVMTDRNVGYFISMLIFLGGSIFVGYLIMLNRRQTESARFVVWRATTLHKLSRQITNIRDERQLCAAAEKFLSSLFSCEIKLMVSEDPNFSDVKERDIVQWVYRMGQPAGKGTDTLSMRDVLYLPLLASQSTIGVMQVQPLLHGQLFTPEEIHLLEACASQIALAIEIDRLQETTVKSEINASIEHARNELLFSIARDLQSPLSAIMAYARIQETLSAKAGFEKIQQSSECIYHEAEQLNQLVSNILQISWIDQGLMKPHREPVRLTDMVNSLVTERYVGRARFEIEFPQDLPAIPVDSALIREVFLNLMDNAVRFSPKNKAIRITARKDQTKVTIRIEDHGPGIPAGETEKVFEKFYQGRTIPSTRGLGLGLTICRKIIESHGGKIWAENRKEGGAAFCFTLPLQKMKK